MKKHRLLKLICCTALGVLLLAADRVYAQSGDSISSDLEQLKGRLQQLEEEMQMLKDRINAANDKRQLASGEGPVAGSASAQTTGEKPVSEVKKSNVNLYGFVMLDSGYEFGQSDPSWFDVMRPTKLAAFPGEFAPDGKVFFSMRQTRFGLKTATPTRFGQLNTLFEFELFGTGVDAGQTTFRLRHAYGELGQFGAGQTWSLFMDPDIFPNQFEYWGPSGIPWFRNVQARWMPLHNEKMHLMFAVERPGASADQGDYAQRIELQNVRPKFDMPDFSWQARVVRHWGHLQLAGLFRKISWVDTAPKPTFHLGGDALGWGLNLSSNINLSKTDIGRFDVIYGSGVENYMNDAPADVGLKNNFSNATKPVYGVALPVLGVTMFIDHTWSQQFSTALGYSLINIENSSGQSANAFHQGHYALTNLWYHPVSSVTVGGEFQYGRRVNFHDGFNVNDYRMQFSFKYDWKKLWEF